MTDGTADSPCPHPIDLSRVATRLLAAGLVMALGWVVVTSPAGAAGPATKIVLTSTPGFVLVGHPTTLTATVEDAGGNTVTTGPDSSVSITFAQTGGTGTVTGLGPFPAVNGVANDVVTGSTIGNDVVDFQASATLMVGATASNTLPLTYNAFHGIAFSKSCNGTTPIGQLYECRYQISNTSTIVNQAQDTETFKSIVDKVFSFDAPSPKTSVNLLPSLTLNLSGGASCTAGNAVCTLPFGATISSDPTSFYTVVPDDYNLTGHVLNDTATVTWNDLCDGGSGNCSMSDQANQAPSSTTVALNTPSVSTQLTPPGPVAVGTPVTDQATLNGASPFAGGTVSYAVFSNSACSAPVAALGTKPVTNATVGPSNAWTAVAGNYWFQATYSGDGGDVGPVSSSCSSEPITVESPSIGITKLPAAQTIASGGTATWTIVVTNTGDAPLTNVSVADGTAPDCIRAFAGTLAVGASEIGYSCSLTGRTATFTNTAMATGTPPLGPNVTATASALVTVGALGPVVLYVNPASQGGNDTDNNCTLAAKPCATIGYALHLEATEAPDTMGSVINLSKGTFNSPECNSPSIPDIPAGCDSMFAALTPANSNVTIDGTGQTGSNAVIVEPTTCSALPVVAGGPSNGQAAIVTFNAGENGITVENMNLVGAAVAGGQCPTYQAAVIDTGGTTGDAVVGDVIEGGTTYGILTNGGSDSTIISNKLQSNLCSTTVTGPNTGLNAGWTSPANLTIRTLPKCALFKEAGHGAATALFINNVTYCATFSVTKKILVITGTPAPILGCSKGGTPITNSAGPDIATGAQIIFNTSVAPFTQFGIACNSPLQVENQATDCALSDNTVTAGGTVYGDVGGCGGFPPVGIVATGGATANIDGNSVSGVADVIGSCPVVGESTNDGVGIGLLPDTMDHCSAGPSVVGVNDANSPATGHGNTLGATAANDLGIVVSGNVGSTCTDANPFYQVNGNTVSAGNRAGIVLTNLGFTNGSLDPAQPMENNSVSGVATGTGIELEGVKGQTIGGLLTSQGNASTGNGMGLVLAPCLPLALHPLTPPGCATYLGAPVLGAGEATQANFIRNNTMTGNVAFGVLAVGSFQPNEVAAPTSTPLASSGNTFNADTWGNSSSATNGTAPSQINGAEVMDGTGWGGGCQSEPGVCPTAGVGPLLFEGPNTSFSSSSPGSATFTLAVCNSGSVAEILPVGTEITFPGPNDGGTFFVTQAAIIAGNPGCAGPSSSLSLQAVAPADVGTLDAPTGQPYILGTGDTVTVNANGSTVVPSGNFWGKGATSDSCAPSGVTQASGTGPPPLNVPHPALTTANVFGATGPYSTTLLASTGGVNATYSAC